MGRHLMKTMVMVMDRPGVLYIISWPRCLWKICSHLLFDDQHPAPILPLLTFRLYSFLFEKLVLYNHKISQIMAGCDCKITWRASYIFMIFIFKNSILKSLLFLKKNKKVNKIISSVMHLKQEFIDESELLKPKFCFFVALSK